MGRTVEPQAAAPTRVFAWADQLARDSERQDLPYLHWVEALPMGTTSFEVVLSNEVYTPLTNEELALLPGLGTPDSRVIISKVVGWHRKVPQARVSIYPYRRDPASGRVERLVSYDHTIQSLRSGEGGARANTYPDHSKLASGDWYRFTVDKDGVYSLTYDFLQQLGVDVSDLASDAINVYGNHAGMLPFTNMPFQPTDLLQNAVVVEDGGDGRFGPGDRVLFHASGPTRWVRTALGFEHVKNIYSETASYFIGIGTDPPKRISTVNSTEDPATDQVTSFVDMQVIDRDVVNVLKSGRTMFAELYDNVTTYNYSFQVPNIRASDPVALRLAVFGRTVNNQTSTFSIQAGSHSESFPVTGVSGSYEGAYGAWTRRNLSFNHGQAVLPITVTFNKYDPMTSLGYMDYLQLNARRDLRLSSDQLLFRDTTAVGAGRVADFTIEQGAGLYRVWDVTDPTGAVNVNFTTTGTQRTFRLTTDVVRTFIAFRNTGYLVPVAAGRVNNQDLHATQLPMDLVIVCPDIFRSEAQRLAERRMAEGLTVALVEPQQIYNEFSSGQRDASAIKRYMKMLYDRAGADQALMPRYLLLFGDGVFNNLIPDGTNQNYIPTYQTVNSWTPSSSYTSDDFYGLLDDAEGEADTDLVDIGVGRFPVSDRAQARAVVNKVLSYDQLSLLSTPDATCTTGSEGGANDWRNWMLFVSDDLDGNGGPNEPFHTTNSEALSALVDIQAPGLNHAKVYMDAYTQYSTPGGQRYPDGANALRERVQKGCLVVNYVGHGGEVGWGHERFLDVSTILGWTNADRLALFMTATCEFSRWDDPARTSAGEYVLLNEHGGGVGLLTTTRIAYSSPNQAINVAFYNHVFLPTDELGRSTRLGDTCRRTKVAIPSGSAMYQRSFALLADPSLRLALPKRSVYITSVTDTLGQPVDTIAALSVVRITGYVGDASGPDSDFNGLAIPTMFDKEQQMQTLANDQPANPVPFRIRKSVLHKGKATVTNGQFNFTFMVPRDINYAVGAGRISVYAESSTTNATGMNETYLVGGSNPHAVADGNGPEIQLHLNDERFVNGGITNETPLLWAKLFDQSGINTTGNGIGHDLTAVVDANTANAIVLNDVYEADKDTYKSGQVRYRLANLAEGPHTLTFKAWDVFNNSNERTVDFVVTSSEELALDHVLNYPNPFTTRTEFYFEHNRPCATLECQVQVFTVAGRLVKTINRRLNCEGFRSEPLAWDGLDDFGDRLGRGVYVYRLSITAGDGAKADKVEKLVILR